MDAKRLKEIATEFHLDPNYQVLSAMEQAVGEAVQELKAKYLGNFCECDIEKYREQGRDEIRRDFCSLLHVKGWDE